MKVAAWRYSHHSQLILDGTFDVCNRKLLLSIAMGINEDLHGVPLAFFLFSAPSGNKQTSLGYDAFELSKLLSKWKGTLLIFFVLFNFKNTLPKLGNFAEFLPIVTAAPPYRLDELRTARDGVAALLSQLDRSFSVEPPAVSPSLPRIYVLTRTANASHKYGAVDRLEYGDVVVKRPHQPRAKGGKGERSGLCGEDEEDKF
ncbi:hypothetical protein AURDEDRAFT_169297 [Auricularia subglabra TFB-10046 SS5]|nr:hypothetical protein AURDEDRAFT_169297 [Auricularia subglabra TFB-10046 SS5]